MKNIIIIPYRDRKKHLDYYLKNSYLKLKEKIKNLEVIIVEQVEGKKFNRGKTINIGYHYYSNEDYQYITQDVDVNPFNEKVIEKYNEDVSDNKFFGIYSDGRTLGGVVKFKGKSFKKVNGFPNDYWGWGHEDKDLQNRADFYKCKIEKFLTFQEFEEKAKYFKIFQDEHNREDCGKWGLAYGIWDKVSKGDQKIYIENNGLSTLNYKIIKEELLMENVKKITVEI
jgi:hypothetical protein